MRKLVLLGSVAACAGFVTAGTPNPAFAWCRGGYLYDYDCASPAYRFALSPWGYRSAYQSVDAARAWGGWGYRGRDLSDRRSRWRRR